MKTYKKILLLTLIFLMCFCIFACDNAENRDKTNNANDTGAPIEKNIDDEKPNDEGNKKGEDKKEYPREINLPII